MGKQATFQAANQDGYCRAHSFPKHTDVSSAKETGRSYLCFTRPDYPLPLLDIYSLLRVGHSSLGTESAVLHGIISSALSWEGDFGSKEKMVTQVDVYCLSNPLC